MDASAPDALNAKDAAALLARGPFAATLARGEALVIATGQPPRAAFATPAGLAMFGAPDLGAMDDVVGARSPGARRLRQLSQSLPLGGAPRLEQLRFFAGRTPVLLGLSCARVAGPDGASYLVAAVAGNASIEPPPVDVAEETPPPATEPDAPPFSPSPLDGPIRFLWSLDAEGRFGATDPALAARLGPHAPRPGEPLEALRARVAFDPSRSFVAAIAAARTFSASRLDWPEPGFARARVSLMSGTPQFDRERKFAGFRGFGVFTGEGAAIAAPEVSSGAAPAPPIEWPAEPGSEPVESAADEAASGAVPPPFERPELAGGEAAECAAPEVSSAAAPPPPIEWPAEPRGETVESAAGEASGGAALPPPIEWPAAPGEEAVDSAAGEASSDAAPTPPIEWPEATGGEAAEFAAGEASSNAAPAPPIERPEATGGEAAEAEAGEPSNPSTSDTGPSATSEDPPGPIARQPAEETGMPPPKAGRDGGAEIFVLRQTAPLATGGLNVVPIRPGAGSAPTSTPNSPDTSSGGDAEIVELSSQERDAFREIARALGARLRGPRSGDGAPDPGEPVAEPTPAADVEALSPFEQAAAEELLIRAREETAHRDAAALIDVLPIGALVLRDGDATYLNRTLLDLVGFADIEEFRAGEGLRRTFLGRDPATLATAGESGETPMMTKGGELITVDTLTRPISWDGEPAMLVALRRSRDMEHRTRLRELEGEAELAMARARAYEAALDLTADGVVRLDASRRILSMNAGAASLLGHPPRDAEGENFVSLLAPASHAAAIARFEAVSQGGASADGADGVEVFARASGRDSIPMRLSFGRLPTSSEPEYCAVITDLSELKAAEREGRAAREKAEKASAAKTDFLAQVSHEIRTPLNAILGFAEVIMEEKFGPIGNDKYKDYLKDIHASGQHVLSLANDLLDLAKIEAGRMELAFSPVDANRIIRECVAQMQPQAARERIIMRLSLSDKLPNVMADERALRQIMLNLMSNAVKFNEPGGQVIVSTALDESGHPIIRVRDTGLGMDERELSVALEPFRQLPGGRRDDGTGLGLPLTKALVEANHADFSIKSRKEHGTLVEVAFPSVRAAQ